MKRPASASIEAAPAKRIRLGSDFWDYVTEVNKKHDANYRSSLDPVVAAHAFPPTNLQEETNVKFAQQVLGRVAAGDRQWQLLLIMLFQAPDHCWSFHGILNPLVRGVLAQRAGKSHAAARQFDVIQRFLQKRADQTGVFGNGERGIYNAEHLTATMKGKSHVEALRVKLEKWPAWIEGSLGCLLKSWPAANDEAGIKALLKQPRFARKLPGGVQTKVLVGKGRCVPLVGLFGGSERKACSVVSQALLFAEMLKPADKEQRRLRRTSGWGAGPFVLRGLWMDVQKDCGMLKNFPQIDSETFCPGFTGALGGAAACNLEAATGISLNPGRSSAPNWSSWDVQVRFAAWLHALQAAQPKGSGPKLHCTELEGCLCFFLRYRTMKTHPEGSQEFALAKKAIGSNIAPETLRKIFARGPIQEAKRILWPAARRA